MSLVEAMVAVAIVVLLAGAVLPPVLDRMQRDRGVALSATLQSAAEAIAAYRRDTGHYPSRLSQLVSPTHAGALDSCGSPAPGGAAWRGPYLDRAAATPVGLRVGSALLADSLQRAPVAGASPDSLATLTIVATGVDAETAAHLDTLLDGSFDPYAGRVRWRSATAFDELRYEITVRGC